MDPNVGN